jgi:glycosyltransferase involved in cell wall biosynthesis
LEVHQLVARAASAEPATAEAVRLRRLLLEHGPSEILSLEAPEAGIPGARAVAEGDAPAGRPGRLLIAHVSDAEGLVLRYLADRPEHVVLRLQEEADERLAALRPRTGLALAASLADAERLRTLGFARVAAVPPAVSQQELARRGPAAGLPLPPRRGAALVLCVDPLAPGQGCEGVVQAFHVLKTYLRTDAHLLLAGPKEEPAYRAVLQRYVTELALPHVRLRSGLSSEQLAQAYGRADVLCSLSSRPSPLALLRALAFAVPVVGLAAGSAGELLDGAGLLLDRPSPALAAEALAALLEEETASRLRGAARARLAALRPESGVGAIVDAVRSVAA